MTISRVNSTARPWLLASVCFLPSCVAPCAEAAGYQAGCSPYDLTCVCSNNAFIDAASSCVWQSCSYSDAQTAIDYWSTSCGQGGYGPPPGTESTTTVTPPGYGPPTTSSPITSTTPYYYGGSSSPTSSPDTSSSPYYYGGSSSPTSSPDTSSNPYYYGGSSSPTSSPVTSSNPYYYGGSSSPTSTPVTSSKGNYGGGSTTSSRPSSSTSSNLAATMPTHAAALIAGGIGAVVAVFV